MPHTHTTPCLTFTLPSLLSLLGNPSFLHLPTELMEKASQRSSGAVKADTYFQPGENQKTSKDSEKRQREKGSAPSWHGPDRRRSKSFEMTSGAFYHVSLWTGAASGCLGKQSNSSQERADLSSRPRAKATTEDTEVMSWVSLAQNQGGWISSSVADHL